MKTVLKGIVFYAAILLAMLYIAAIDSLNCFMAIGGFAVLFALFLFCANKITEKEYEKITFAKYLKE